MDAHPSGEYSVEEVPFSPAMRQYEIYSYSFKMTPDGLETSVTSRVVSTVDPSETEQYWCRYGEAEMVSYSRERPYVRPPYLQGTKAFCEEMLPKILAHFEKALQAHPLYKVVVSSGDTSWGRLCEMYVKGKMFLKRYPGSSRVRTFLEEGDTLKLADPDGTYRITEIRESTRVSGKKRIVEEFTYIAQNIDPESVPQRVELSPTMYAQLVP